MAKLTLNDIAGAYASKDLLNANFALIEAAFENTLSLDGTSPNQLSADLDFNNNNLLNAQTINCQGLLIAGVSIVAGDTLTVPSAANVPNTPAGNIAATDVQTALDELDTEKGGLALANTWTGINTFSAAVNFDGAVDFDSTVQVDGVMSHTARVEWSKGADIASTSTITPGTDGNYFDITGTTSILAIADVAVGTIIKLHFDAALTLTHHATNLILPGAANITTAAGDEAEFVQYATGDWRCTNYQRADGTKVVNLTSGEIDTSSLAPIVQLQYTQTGAVSTTTTVMVNDDTIPQNTEGAEFMTVAITPKSASNLLKIDVVLFGNESTNVGDIAIAALFQDTTADAIAAGSTSIVGVTEGPVCIKFTHYMTAGTTSATTFKVRAGMEAAGTFVFNGGNGTGRKFGGVCASSITVTEILQ